MTVLEFERLELEIVLGEGFRVWADQERLDVPSDPTDTPFRSLPHATEAILRGNLMGVYDVVEDASTLRVHKRMERHQGYAALQEESGLIWQNSNGIMSSSVLNYVHGPFLTRIEAISKSMGWSVSNRECNADFVQAMAAYHGGDANNAWIHAASNTPCLCVNIKTGFSFEKRMYSSFDGSSADRICKSDVNIYDLFLVVACDGDVLVLKQKNNCSVSLVPTLLSGGSKKYIFEIGGLFADIEAENFLYFTNGIICDPLKWIVRSTDNQYRFCQGQLSLTLAALACRFRAPYTLVANFLRDKRKDGGFNVMTGDHCDIDSGNNSMWNLRLATALEQNENKSGSDFAFQELDLMDDEDGEMLSSAFVYARNAGDIYRLYCPNGDTLSPSSDKSLYQALKTVGKGWDSVWYFRAENGDTILLKTSNPYDPMFADIAHGIQFLSMRLYITKSLCDVSDCAAQQRYTQITIDGGKHCVSRSLAFSNVLHHGHQSVGLLNKDGVNYAQVRDGEGNNLHVHHKNNRPRHNFVDNLAIITQSENNSHAQQNIKARDQFQGTRGVSVVFTNSGRLTWSGTSSSMSLLVTSFREASALRRQSDSSSFVYSLYLQNWDPTKEDEYEAPEVLQDGGQDIFSFEISRDEGIQRVRWSLKRLYWELQQGNFKVTMRSLQTLVKKRKRCNRCIPSHHGPSKRIVITVFDSNNKPMNIMAYYGTV